MCALLAVLVALMVVVGAISFSAIALINWVGRGKADASSEASDKDAPSGMQTVTQLPNQDLADRDGSQ